MAPLKEYTIHNFKHKPGTQEILITFNMLHSNYKQTAGIAVCKRSVTKNNGVFLKMVGKKYKYKDIIPEERKNITKEWNVKAEKKAGDTKRDAEEKISNDKEEKESRIKGEAESKKKKGKKERSGDEKGDKRKKSDKKKDESPDETDFEQTIDEARDSVKRAIEDVVDLGNTILGTPKGREHIEKKAKKAGKKLTRTLEYILKDAGKKIKK